MDLMWHTYEFAKLMQCVYASIYQPIYASIYLSDFNRHLYEPIHA